MKIKRITTLAIFVALMAVMSQISFPLGPIPFSCGILGALICGLMLAPKDSLMTLVVYLLLGAIGLPVFAGFSGGISVLFGMTGGYLIGYVLISVCTSIASEKTQALPPQLKTVVILFSELIGVLLCYALGTAWFMFLSGNSFAAALSACVLPFLPGDAIKIVLAYYLAKILKQRLSKAGLSPVYSH